MRRKVHVGWLLLDIAAILVVVGVGVGLWWAVTTSGPPEGKARREVQAYYDRIAAGEYRVLECDYIDESSAWDHYDCAVERRCPGVRAFSVPRAGYAHGSQLGYDADPSPYRGAQCAAGPEPAALAPKT